jgi:anaerobic selenocysteine-containing dehydrogenase
VVPHDPGIAPGRFRLSTRRGKQFNTMVWAERDPLTGAHRDAIFIAAADAERLGLSDGDAALVHSDHGELRGHIHLAPMALGNVQVLFPEGNVLLPMGRREPLSGVPDYNAIVDVVPVP